VLAVVVIMGFALLHYLKEEQDFSGAKPLALQNLILIGRERFAGTWVLVNGYLGEKDGSRSIYPSKEVAEFGLVSDGLYVSATQWAALESCMNMHVSVQGLYDFDSQGILGIVDVHSIAQLDETSNAIIPCKPEQD